MQKLFIGLIGVLIAGCATGYQPRWYFNEVQAVNLSGERIRDVRINVVNSNKVVACDEVAPFAMCQRRFGKRRYGGQGIQLNWTSSNGNPASEALLPQVPAYYSPGLPLRIVMEVQADGSVKAFYEQEQPGRNGSEFLD